MTIICGVELKSSEAYLVALDWDNDDIDYINIEPRKIKLGNDESNELVQSFFDSVVNYAKDNHIDTFVIKKRAKRGRMAGGAVSFKLEALIQLNGVASVKFVSGQGIAAENKKNPFNLPNDLKKYQENAYMAACLFIRKS